METGVVKDKIWNAKDQLYDYETQFEIAQEEAKYHK